MPESRDERLALPIDQGVLLWCMRIWVVGRSRPVAAEHRITEVLRRFGAPDASAPVERFMAALRDGAARTLGVDCVCRPRVSEDERALLDAVALVQQDRPLEALLVLRGMLTPEGAHAALRCAEELAAALTRAGRILPAPEHDVHQYVWSPAPGQAVPQHPTAAMLH